MQVCKQFNNICKKRLNKGFILAEKFENKCLKSMKSQLPRRESERRNHPLARHCDILSAIETRISMMSMTFNKYIETDLACFIPGKSEQDVDIIDEENSVDDVNKPDESSRSKVQILVLDEIFRVLRIIQYKEFPPKTHEILQELRDLSSMAMEHFDEKIAPSLKFRLPCAKFRAQLQLVADSKQNLCEVSPITNDKLNRVIKVFQKHLRDAAVRNKQRDTISAEHEKEIVELKAQMVQLKKVISDMSKGEKTPGEPESTQAILNDSKEDFPKKRALTEYYNTPVELNTTSALANYATEAGFPVVASVPTSLIHFVLPPGKLPSPLHAHRVQNDRHIYKLNTTRKESLIYNSRKGTSYLANISCTPKVCPRGQPCQEVPSTLNNTSIYMIIQAQREGQGFLTEEWTLYARLTVECDSTLDCLRCVRNLQLLMHYV
uniref:Uncharacterized protein n=1 Tax=Timema shepardi TaxID=629360 RepID=A0A7R9AX09_TIMSH|nr:unnamed protein product [Timema shepardi]